ncbi:MAG: protein kinase [Anaeromyxobacter sp.]
MRKGESGDAPVEPPEFEHLSTQLSALLLELVKTQEAPSAKEWSPEVRPGGHIGRFELVRELGRGGFGLVYEAEDRDLGRTVALKVIKPGTRIASRGHEWLQREAEAVARLNHPNIVTLHDFGQGPSGPYLVFELLRGRSLGERLRHGPLPFDDLLEVAIAVARALVHAHDAGVIHRDLTPGNVHLGEDASVKVLDFGLAHLFGRDGASDGGTPAYMAPEQWEGDRSDARTDLFAFGVILHQALAGKIPYLVEKGWSEALEPGETPALARKLAPAAFRRLVRRCLERDPARRPASAREVRDALLAVRNARKGRARRWSVAALTAVAVGAVGTAAWLSVTREPPAGEQVKVVLAGIENGAADPALQAVPGLLDVALSPSARVRVVPKTRLAVVAREAGLAELAGVDARRGRDLARLAGAAVLLVPSSWQEDGATTLAVRAIEAESGKVLFTARERLGDMKELTLTVDWLSDRIREELRERSADRRLRTPVAQAVTRSPDAARLYYEGVDCIARVQAQPGAADRCVPSFERALAEDPGFALAHYQLAAIRSPRGATPDMYQAHLRAALGAAERLPVQQALAVRALAARLEGKTAEASRLYEEMLSRDPDDAEALSGLVSVHIDQQDWAGVEPFAEKLTRLFPATEEHYLILVEALGRSDRRQALRALVQRMDEAGSPLDSAMVSAYCWLGDAAGAQEAARRAHERRGDAALDALRDAASFAGDFREVEAVARRQIALSPDNSWRRSYVASGLAGQGRLAQALRLGDAIRAEAPRGDTSRGLYRDAMLAAGSGNPTRVARSAVTLAGSNPAYAADLAIVLLLLGDEKTAAEVGKAIPPGTNQALQFQALRAWRAGDLQVALAKLAQAEAQDPFPVRGLSPAYLTAEVSAAAGDDGATLAAIARFRRLPPRGFWRSWAYPRSILLAAQAHQRLGERAQARAELDRLLALFSGADQDLPLLKAARALERRL